MLPGWTEVGRGWGTLLLVVPNRGGQEVHSYEVEKGKGFGWWALDMTDAVRGRAKSPRHWVGFVWVDDSHASKPASTCQHRRSLKRVLDSIN